MLTTRQVFLYFHQNNFTTIERCCWPLDVFYHLTQNLDSFPVWDSGVYVQPLQKGMARFMKHQDRMMSAVSMALTSHSVCSLGFVERFSRLSVLDYQTLDLEGIAQKKLIGKKQCPNFIGPFSNK